MAKQWSTDEIKILKEHYPTIGAKGCKQLLDNRTVSSIKKYASFLNINCNTKWTPEKNELLQQMWLNSTKEELLTSFYPLTYSAIQGQAMRLKLPHNIMRCRKGSLQFFNTLDNNLVYYWWGFFLADGCLSNRHEFIITISDRDFDNLQLLANKLKTKVKIRKNIINDYGIYNSCSIRIRDLQFSTKWKHILNLENRQKTYNAPDISIFYDKKYLIYLLIGLIDGDGCISKTRSQIKISISNHISWQQLYKELFQLIYAYYDIQFKLRIDGHGCIQANLCKKQDIKKLYNYAIQCSDILHRKWDKIKEQFDL